jgi:hypothetical protein
VHGQREQSARRAVEHLAQRGELAARAEALEEPLELVLVHAGIFPRSAPASRPRREKTRGASATAFLSPDAAAATAGSGCVLPPMVTMLPWSKAAPMSSICATSEVDAGR